MDTTAKYHVLTHEPTAAVRVLFTGEEEHRITLVQAAKLTANYRMMAGASAVKGGYFGRAVLEKILGQEEAVGIRIYFARQTDGSPTFVLSGVNGQGNDLFRGYLAEDAYLCPPWCGTTNPLNADTTIITRPKNPVARFTGMENHGVTLAEAGRLIQNYRAASAAPGPKGGYFSRKIWSMILEQAGCIGIRIYFAALETGTPTFVLVGVKEDASDIAWGVLAEDAYLCPPWCGRPNPLNR